MKISGKQTEDTRKTAKIKCDQRYNIKEEDLELMIEKEIKNTLPARVFAVGVEGLKCFFSSLSI
jgi:hypothetical protein